MKGQKKMKRTIAGLLLTVFLLTLVPLPVTAFAEGEEAAPAPVADAGGEVGGGDVGAGSGGDAGAAAGGDTGAASGSEGAAAGGDTGAATGDDAGVATGDDAGAAADGDAGVATGDDASAAADGDTGAASGDDASAAAGDDTGAASGDDTDATAGDDKDTAAGDDTSTASGDDASAASVDDTGAAVGGVDGGSDAGTSEAPAQVALLLSDTGNSVLPVAAGLLGDTNNSDSTDPDWTVTYDYNAGLYDPDSGNYTGVYTAKLNQNTDTAETADTIGMPSIADKNLPDVPTTESPAIIQGAAVGYEEKTGPTEYTPVEGRTKPDPYSEFTVKVLSEQAADGTTHQKLSGFDGTYVIVRLDVSEFLSAGSDNLYLHMEQKDNKALMPAATVAKPAADATGTASQVDPKDYTPVNSFTDALGNRSAAYKLSDLLDGSTPYLDVILYATAANVSGADAGKQNAANGDVPLALYVDNVDRYTAAYETEHNITMIEYDPTNSSIVDQQDANAATAYDNAWHAKFFNAESAGKDNIAVSHYLVKGSDLALETSVENSGGENKDTGTTYWSLKKSMEDPYYDQEIDKDPTDAGSGRTVKLMSEVAVTNGLSLQGSSESDLKKRTLDVNSFDIQVATNTGTEGSAAEDITLQNAWLTIADKSNTTGAEMAIGNNAQFVIDQGGKLIIDETCQLEIEWDGATTTPGQPEPSQPDILNNGQLDLRAGGEIINNGIITIEGTEGKPVQPGQEQQADSQKGSGEMTIRKDATLTNNGSLVVYGKLNNLGTLVNNGRYNDVIKSNDPDKGAFDYHKGIQVAWKDDVTQKNVEAGTLTNGAGGTLINNGDIVLTPGTLDNKGTLRNEEGANIYSAPATEAIIPITPDPATPTIISKRIKLDPIKLSNIVNSGTLTNNGSIMPATVALNDNIGFGSLYPVGTHPELFLVENSGELVNNGYIYPGTGGGSSGTGSGAVLMAALAGSVRTVNDTWLYLYKDGTFLMIFYNGERQTGTFRFVDDMLTFTLSDGTVVEPVKDEAGDWAYSFSTTAGTSVEFVLNASFVAQTKLKYAR